jgi:paired amphipathic helix protein Sin3a
MDPDWTAYVFDYVSSYDQSPHSAHPTGLLLRRSLRRRPKTPVCARYRLECKICVNTYKLFYVEHTEDLLWRPQREKSLKQPSRYFKLKCAVGIGQ